MGNASDATGFRSNEARKSEQAGKGFIANGAVSDRISVGGMGVAALTGTIRWARIAKVMRFVGQVFDRLDKLKPEPGVSFAILGLVAGGYHFRLSVRRMLQ